MPIYITARGLYAVSHKKFMVAQFSSLGQATAFVRKCKKQPIYTWFN